MTEGRRPRGRIEGIAPAAVTGRTLPVVVLVRGDLDALHEAFDGRRLAVARSIYLALVEMLSEGGAPEFTRAELAVAAGVTRKTLDEYVPSFEAAGMLTVERRREGGTNLPNVWRLASVGVEPRMRECVYCGGAPETLDHVVPESKGGGHRGNVVPCCRDCNREKSDRDVGEWVVSSARTDGWPEVERRLVSWGVRSVPRVASVPSHADHPVHTSSPTSEDGTERKNGTGSSACLPLPDDVDVPDDIRADAAELLRRKTKVDGKLVTPEEMAKAAAAVTEFNRQSGSEFGLGAHLRPVVMRCRERPSYDAAAHVRLVQSAWRIRWWERRQDGRRRGRPTPAVIYGHAGVFEQVVQDAVDEKQGRPSQQVPGSRRFTRED